MEVAQYLDEALHLSEQQLEAGLAHILQSPKDGGVVDMIVRRPQSEHREVLEQGDLDVAQGLLGDNWRARGYRKTADGVAHPEMQINIMNSRVIDLLATSKKRWAMAGDQFFVDLDLSDDNLPPGTRLRIGEAVIEITAEPHLGCKKFVARFGLAAMLFVNSGRGTELNLRGINAKVIAPGKVAVGDSLSKQ